MSNKDDLNFKIKEFTKAYGDKTLGANFNELFPDLPFETLELLETDETSKTEMVKWLENEILGSQFNAVRLCTVPDEDDATPDKFNDELCEAFRICPLYRKGLAPIGCQCPLEKFKASKLTSELVNELEIDIYNDYTDKYIIGELVTYSLLEDRAARGLACLSLGQTTITTNKGAVEYKRQRSFYVEIINDMRKAKLEARRALIATRDDKLRSKTVKQIDVGLAKRNELISKINRNTDNNLLIEEVEADG